MGSLLLFILLSSALYINFRIFDSWKVDRLSVIGVNYLVCILLGIFVSPESIAFPENLFESLWPFLALILGALFLTNFFLTGLTVEKLGLTISSVATKISLVIPFFFSLAIHSWRGFHFSALVGLFFCGLAIWFVSRKEGERVVLSGKAGWLPLMIFLGTGITDVLSQWCNERLVPSGSQSQFVLLVFLGAFFATFLFWIGKGKSRNMKVSSKEIAAGVLLGIPNYYSYFFLLKALQDFNNQGDIVFPVGNLGVILTTTLVAALYFKDRLTRGNLLGILFSILSLFFIFSPL